MRIENPQLGPIEIGEDAIIRIVGGLIGFEGLERYYLFMTETSDPFLWLLSADDPHVLFAVVDPEPFLREPCDLMLAELDRQALDLHPDDPVEVFTLVSPPERQGRLTMNLKGPLVVNPRNRIAKQLVAYSSKQPLRLPISPPVGTGSGVGRTVVRIIDRRAA
jgi:flagellar assembly factor FliW